MKTWHWIAALAGVAVVASYRKPWHMGRRVEGADLSPDELAAARERAKLSTDRDILTDEPLPPRTGKRGRPPQHVSQETKAFSHRFYELLALGQSLPDRGHVMSVKQVKHLQGEYSKASNVVTNNMKICDGELLPGEWPSPFDKHKYKGRDRKGETLTEALAKGKPARVRGGDRKYTPKNTPSWGVCVARPGTDDTGRIMRYSSYTGRKGGIKTQKQKRAKKVS